MKRIGISSCATRLCAPSLRGFSLTELAIVLAVVGLIVGSIWALASQSWENARQQQLKSDMLLVVKNLRAYYASQNGISGTSAILIPQVAALNPSPIPGDMLRKGGTCGLAACADHPWGVRTAGAGTNGSFGLCGWDPSATANCAGGANGVQFFAVELLGMPQGACVKAALLDSGADAPPGLYDVVINGTSILNGAGVTHQFPVKLTDANALCANNATMDFVYRLVTPQS